MAALGIGLGLNRHRGSSYDPDSRAFFARAGVTNPAVRRRHDQMVRGIKSLGVWGDVDLWYNAEAGVFKTVGPNTIPADNEPVRAWFNARRAASDLGQEASLNQPSWSASGGPGGAPAVRGDGVNSFMTCATPTVTNPFTFLLFGSDFGLSGPTSWRMIMAGQGGSGPAALTAHDTERGLIRMTGGWDRMHALYNRSGNYVLAGIFNGASNSAVYRTGAPLYTGTFIASASYGPTFGLFAFPAGNQICSGSVTQAMVFKGALTVPQIQGLEALFSNLYGGLS